MNPLRDKIVAQASNINIGAGGFEESKGDDENKIQQTGSTGGTPSDR